MPATFAQAMSSTSNDAPNSTSSAGRVSPTTASRMPAVVDAHVGVGLRKVAFELRHDALQFRAGLGDGRTGAEEPDDTQVVELSGAVDVPQHRREVEGRVDLGLCHGRKEERGRQHANDRARSSTDVDGLPDDRAVAPEDSAPGAEAKHDRRVDAPDESSPAAKVRPRYGRTPSARNTFASTRAPESGQGRRCRRTCRRPRRTRLTSRTNAGACADR